MVTIDTAVAEETYLNNLRVQKRGLHAGDVIYIMGLKLVVGDHYLAINNPDAQIQIKCPTLRKYVPQKVDENSEIIELPEKKFFFRPPRFYREIERGMLKVDTPPQQEKVDTVPVALLLGPAITMGRSSISYTCSAVYS